MDAGKSGDHVVGGFRWPLIWILGVLAFILGWIGFREYGPEHGVPTTHVDAIYLTLQLFILHTVHLTHPIPWTLNLARFLAPAVLGATAFFAFLALFREHLQALRLSRQRGHVVVCGLGEVGMQLVRDARANGERVVAIERDPGNERAAAAARVGAIVLVGDATEEGVLQRAGADRARLVAAVMASDAANVQVATRIAGLVRRRRQAAAEPLKCFIYVNDVVMRSHFRRDARAFPACGGRLAVTVVGLDTYENSARLLFQQHPLDQQPITRRDDPRRAHLVVIRFGQMGQAVLLQAVKIAHFANGSRLQVTVIDPAAARWGEALRQRHPQLQDICDITWCLWEADDPARLDELAALCRQPNTLVTYAMCFDDDARNLSLALTLLPKIEGCGSPILARMSSSSGLASVLLDEVETTSLSPHIRPFGMVEQIFSREMLLQEQLDRIARRIHEEFRDRRIKEGQSPDTNPALYDWERLDVDYKDSNRQQADHLRVKLRTIGCHASAPRTDGTPSVTAFSHDEIELLAEMEHARWIAERKLAGWTHAPGAKDTVRKTSPYLVPWAELAEDVKDFDRQAVVHIPALLREVGVAIYR